MCRYQPFASASTGTAVTGEGADGAAQKNGQPTATRILFYDCYHGTELTPARIPGTLTFSLSFKVEGLGYGCVFATPTPIRLRTSSIDSTSSSGDGGLKQFLAEMAAMVARGALASFNDTWASCTIPSASLNVLGGDGWDAA